MSKKVREIGIPQMLKRAGKVKLRFLQVSQKCGKIQNEILQMSKKVREPQIGMPRLSKIAGNAGNWNSLNVKKFGRSLQKCQKTWETEIPLISKSAGKIKCTTHIIYFL